LSISPATSDEISPGSGIKAVQKYTIGQGKLSVPFSNFVP